MEEDERLIDLTQSYTCLYDGKSADFKVTVKKENAWVAIAAAMEKNGEL